MNVFLTLYNGLLTLLSKMSEVSNWFLNASIRIPILTEIREPPTAPGEYGNIYTEFVLTDISPFALLTVGVVSFIITIFTIKLIKAVLDCIPVA